MESSPPVDRDTIGSNTPVFAPYSRLANRRDEAIDKSGQIRPEWTSLFESVGRHGQSILSTWRNETTRLSRERGLAYRSDTLIDAGEPSRGWTLDPIPWVISQASWSEIEKGVEQRIRLHSAILKDLYSSRRILAENLVPARIVESHPGFLRSLHDCPPGPMRPGLGMVAIDIARDNGGQYFTLNDRTDCPFGLSLALENRTVVNSVLPNLFQRNRIRRIGHFLVDWFDHLASFSPPQKENPAIAILDRNPKEGDSEVSFLANYCRILRVVPSDLTVREGKVWLKTVRGLTPIDVLWKNIIGRSLDPLETGHLGFRGIPGSFEAFRRGTVAIASHPGSEILQSPGLFPYLPKLCRALLGEELRIPPVATWWCGEERARKYVIDNLPNMVIKSVGPHRNHKTTYGSLLTQEQLGDLRSRILTNPWKYVGQEKLTFSTIPISTDSTLSPRGAVLRAFGFHGRKDKVQIMPGGLARLGTTDDVVVSTRLGGESKDVWIRHKEEDETVSLPKDLRRFQLVQPETTSHAAENLFWSGRNAERIDLISRFLHRTIEGRMFGFSHPEEEELLHENFLLDALFSFSSNAAQSEGLSSNEEKVWLPLRDAKNTFSISSQIQNFRRTTFAAREHWSTACIRAIESIDNNWADSTRNLSDLFAYKPCLEDLQQNLAAFYGVNHDSMTRGHGWSMLETGRLLERCINIVKILQLRLEKPIPDSIQRLVDESILTLFDSFGTYQSIHRAETETRTVFLLVLDEGNYPRAMRFLLDRIRTVASRLPEVEDGDHPVDFLSQIEVDLNSSCQIHKSVTDSSFLSERSALTDSLNVLENDLYAFGDSITKAYFNLIPDSAP